MTMIRKLSLFQWGKETVRGTLVAATSKMAVENLELTPVDEMSRPALAKGILLPHSGDELPIQRGVQFSVPETPLVYGEHHKWLGMAINGGVSAVGAADPYTWTFARPITADPVPDTYTIERRLTDGTNHVDLEFGYAFLTQLRWIFEDAMPARFAAEGVGRRIQSSTLTAALAMPTIQIPAAKLLKVWMDSAWANLGTSQITGEVRRVEVTFNTGLVPIQYLDGRTDLDFTSYRLNPDEVGLEVEITVHLTKAQFDAQKAAAEAGTLRAVRVKVEGPAADRSLQLDMLLKHESASFLAVEDDDGQVQGTFRMVTATDQTNFFTAVLVNGTNAYT